MRNGLFRYSPAYKMQILEIGQREDGGPEASSEIVRPAHKRLKLYKGTYRNPNGAREPSEHLRAANEQVARTSSRNQEYHNAIVSDKKIATVGRIACYIEPSEYTIRLNDPPPLAQWLYLVVVHVIFSANKKRAFGPKETSINSDEVERWGNEEQGDRVEMSNAFLLVSDSEIDTPKHLSDKCPSTELLKIKLFKEHDRS
ncbi:hypothetical protein BJ165DRAFT_1401368 [Panaeolus papilionaceus]|nr:hypothetical protein BJ165DRAFT_1401368 [Panaeolus papilionaceus]